ncbi:MAG: hypothetical protein M3R38_38925 [Actinomycetota bacterium]|nr:hypothetical protein [Actinomycetota bacterium]MDP9488240.1 hypothetical protein [Actinomycetota bacterium]
MATSLDTRIRKLEDAGGRGECPRCSGVVAVTMNGEFSSASKYGESMTEAEFEEFEDEEEEGRCPVCGEKAPEIVVGWPES